VAHERFSKHKFDLVNYTLLWTQTSAISALPYGWRFGVWNVQFTHFLRERYCHPFSDSVYHIFIHLYSGNWTQYTPSYFLPFLLSCNVFSASFNFLVTGRKLFWDKASNFWCPYDTLTCCVWTLLCSPESWIVVNSHIIQIRIDLCSPLQTALYMPRTCLPPNVNVVFKIHLHLKLQQKISKYTPTTNSWLCKKVWSFRYVIKIIFKLCKTTLEPWVWS
jgi:hypothetical protein